MNISQVTVHEFRTGNGTATGTAQPIIAAGYASKAYKGVQLRCNSGTVYIGPHNVTTANGFELPEGKELLIPIEDPGRIYVVGDGNYSWLST